VEGVTGGNYDDTPDLAQEWYHDLPPLPKAKLLCTIDQAPSLEVARLALVAAKNRGRFCHGHQDHLSPSHDGDFQFRRSEGDSES
jgi:hypothetical protein